MKNHDLAKSVGSQYGNQFNNLNKFKSVPSKINKEFPIGEIRSRLKLDFGKRDIFKHRDREANC